jgi:hypothetical protein
VAVNDLNPAAPDDIDPDPFMIGIAIFSCVASGGAFLEARRTRQLSELKNRGEFRGAWYASNRSLIHFKQATDEFETYIFEDHYGGKDFTIGAVRLNVDFRRKQALRRLKGQALITANILSDNVDDPSEFLGDEYQEAITELLGHLSTIGFPQSYRELISKAREAINLYAELLEDIGTREQFELLGENADEGD